MIKGLVATMISFAIFFQLVDTPSAAQAASCSSSGRQSGSLKHSGQVTPVSATVCGNQLWKLLGKPKKPVKPVKSTKPRKYSNNFTVVPDKPKISGQSNLGAGELNEFSSSAKRHVRNRLLFWYPSQVRFTPKAYTWSFGDGQLSLDARPTHSWATKGNYKVKLVVGYSVKYRIVGRSKWVSLAGLVFASSAPFTVTVGASAEQSSSKVLLVHWTCDQKPTAQGC
jgi:hypothetical protein